MYLLLFGPSTIASLAANPALKGVIEQFGGKGSLEAVPSYGALFTPKYWRGNIDDKFICRVIGSYASNSAASAALIAARALRGTQAALVLTPYPGANTVTMLNAICSDVQRVRWENLALELRYTFDLTQLTTSP